MERIPEFEGMEPTEELKVEEKPGEEKLEKKPTKLGDMKNMMGSAPVKLGDMKNKLGSSGVYLNKSGKKKKTNYNDSFSWFC